MNEKNTEKGFLPIYRSLFDHWVWDNKEPFDKRSAWIDLLRSAEIETTKKFVSGKRIDVNRGQILCSVRFLQERWNWASTMKVRKFLEHLEEDSMIVTKVTQGITVVTICNYEEYNRYEKTDNTAKTQQKHTDNTPITHAGHEINNITNKQINNREVSPTVPVETTPDFENMNLPEDLKSDFVKATTFVLENANLKKIPQSLSAKDFVKLREKYDHEQVMEVLGIMANSKAMKNKTSIYLTALNIAKSTFGSEEQKKHYVDFEAAYKAFINKNSNGEASAKIDSFEKRALLSIMAYLKENSNEKSMEGALKSWKYILDNWKKLDNFMQGRIKLQEIDKDIVKIISHIKNAATGPNNKTTGNTAKDTSERKEF